jgi:hypothetical protein
MQRDCANTRIRHGVAAWAAMISFFGVIGGVLYWSLSVSV